MLSFKLGFSHSSLPSSRSYLESKDDCPKSAESEISIVFLCTGFWNSNKDLFILGEVPLGTRLDLGWCLERDQALSLWSEIIDFKTIEPEN